MSDHAPAPRKRKHRRSIAEIEAALKRTYGTVAAAARLLGMNRQYLHERIAKTPRLQETLEEAREFMVDTAELKLVTLVQEGDVRAITFMLSRIGKARGWGSEVTLNHRRLDVKNMSTDELKAVLRAAYGDDDDEYEEDAFTESEVSHEPGSVDPPG